MTCLSFKIYLLKYGKKYKLSCKGVSRAAIQDFESIFRKALLQKENVFISNQGFRARQHTVCTYRQKKIGFGYFYCKRMLSPNGIETKPLNIALTPLLVFIDSTYWTKPRSSGRRL